MNMGTAYARTRRVAGVAALACLAAYPLVSRLDVALDRLLGLPLQLERLMVSTFIFALLALSLHVQLGLAGLMQLGGAALTGTGAYAFALVTVQKLPFQWPFLAAAALAVAVAAAVGAVLGLLCARVRGDAVAMVTLAFGEVWRTCMVNGEAITDGARGLSPLAGPALPSAVQAWVGDPSRADFVALYLAALSTLVAGSALCAWLSTRPLGRAWAAARADPLAAEACGLSVAALRSQAMAVGGALAGAGGALYAAYLTTTAEPNAYDYNLSVMALAAVVLGGLGSVRGALFGAAFVTAIDVALGPVVESCLWRLFSLRPAEHPWVAFAQWRWLVFGLLLVATMRLRPRGVWGHAP